MSYRAFKRLLGETSLERKCRFLFGAGVLVLLTLTLGLYAYQAEILAYSQAVQTCKLLVTPALTQEHLARLQAKDDPKLDGKHLQEIFVLAENQYHFLTYNRPFENGYERDLFKDFAQDEKETDALKHHSAQHVLLYYAAVR